jgi:hypothetical protein
MKIYNITGTKKTKEWKAVDGTVIQPSKELPIVELNQETVDWLKSNGGGTVTKIKYLICHLYNSNTFPLDDFDILGLMRNTDEEHGELVISLFELMNIPGDQC